MILFKAEVERLACSRLQQTTLITVAEGCVRANIKRAYAIITFVNGNRFGDCSNKLQVLIGIKAEPRRSP